MRLDSRTELVVAADIAERLGISRARVSVISKRSGFPSADARALASYTGHASVTITFDRYGHLMPGNEDEAAALLDATSSAQIPALASTRSAATDA